MNASGLDVAAAASAAAALRWVGTPLVEMDLAGLAVWVVGSVDADEVSRRGVAEGPLLDRDVLRALAWLPEGIPVPVESLDVAHRAALESAPASCVAWDDKHVVRHFRPVVEIYGFIRRSLRGERDLEAVSIFAADGARALVVSRSPGWRNRAELLGVGLTRGSALLMPGTRRHVRPGERRWFVQERVWAAVAASRAATTTHQ